MERLQQMKGISPVVREEKRQVLWESWGGREGEPSAVGTIS